MNYIKYYLSLIISLFLLFIYMNCLHIDPNNLIKKIETCRRSFNYNFLEILKKYEIPVHIYYNYLLSIEEFKLKNIWNILVKKWNNMNDELNEISPLFTKSNYNIKYNLKHENINDEILNDRLNEFIDNKFIKGFFLCNTIQSFIIPK